MSPEQMLLQIVGMVFTAGAVWGALRADLRSLIERVNRVEKQLDGLLLHRRASDL